MQPHNEPADALGITGTRGAAEAPHGAAEGREEAAGGNAGSAAARIATYLRLNPGAKTLGGEIAYSEEFRSDGWPRTAYAPTHSDVEALLSELAELRGERTKLIRWHREDETALKEMRSTIQRLRGEKQELGETAARITVWPTYTLQRWNWLDDQWETRQTFTTSRGEGNAYFAVKVERASHTGPLRLLKDGAVEFEDNPETHYAEQPGW